MPSNRTRFNKLIVFILYGLLAINSTRAKDNLPEPIDETLVFGSFDNVEVVETLPLYIADQKQVSFYNEATSTWQSYPYPEFPLAQDEVAQASFVANSDGMYNLKVDYYTPCQVGCEELMGEGAALDYTPPEAARVRERWHFDLKTGIFIPFEAVCGNHARALPNEGEWVALVENNITHLCNTETDQTSISGSSAGSNIQTALLNAPTPSPDGEWLIFTYYFSNTIYAYNFSSSQVMELGTMTTTSPFYGRDLPKITWIDDHRIAVENYTANYGDDHFYLYTADVEKTNSLQMIYHSQRSIPIKLDDPLRFIWTGRQFNDTGLTDTGSNKADCTIHEFYLENPELSKAYYIPGLCSFGTLIPDGSGDRIALRRSSDGTSYTLVRFNLESGIKAEIVVDNFSSLGRISPDGRYLVMTLDTGNYNYNIAILDLQTSLILEPLLPVEDQIIYVEWLGNHTFKRNLSSFYGYDQLFKISDSTISVQAGKFQASSPDKNFLLLESDNRTLDILNVETLKTTTIAQIPDGFMIYAVWEDDDLLTVSVWKDDYYQGQHGRWRIRINPNPYTAHP